MEEELVVASKEELMTVYDEFSLETIANVLQVVIDTCLEMAQMYDDAYTNRSDIVAPSVYLVWRGKALAASELAEFYTKLLEMVKEESNGQDDYSE